MISIVGLNCVDGEWWYYSKGKRNRAYKNTCAQCNKIYRTTAKAKEGRRCKSCANRGENNPVWKGDNILQRSGNARAKAMFKDMGDCEMCHVQAEVRHHRDMETTNNTKENIQMLCHTCHNKIHCCERNEKGQFVSNKN